MIRTGDYLPYFSLYNQHNKLRKNDDYSQGWLVLYVYPKDDTPGCTLEGREFSARKGEFERLQAKVVGLSADDVASHENFCSAQNLSVELLADPQEKLLKELDLEQKEWNGKRYWNRTTLIINNKGVVRFIFNDVHPEGHAREVLARLEKLQDDNY